MKMLRSFRSVVAVVLLSTLSTGCYMARVTSRGTPGIHESSTGLSLFWGLTNTESDADECQFGLQEVSTYFPWYWWFLSGITVGIVMPIVKDYTCNATPPGATPMQPGINYAPVPVPQAAPPPPVQQ